MNPNCARCGKIVYPTEKVNCLDKVSSDTGEASRQSPSNAPNWRWREGLGLCRLIPAIPGEEEGEQCHWLWGQTPVWKPCDLGRGARLCWRRVGCVPRGWEDGRGQGSQAGWRV
jgi:hypothetical protein